MTKKQQRKTLRQDKENRPIEKTKQTIEPQNKLSSSQQNLMFRKRQWSEREDRLLLKAINTHGASKWAFIATFLPNRAGKQCRQRWHNHLNPNINKDEWSDLEQWLLFLMHYLQGGKWSKMTKILTARTDNAIKNHWNSIMQKKIPTYQQKLTALIENIRHQSAESTMKQLSVKQKYLLNKIVQNDIKIQQPHDKKEGDLTLLKICSSQNNNSFGFEDSQFPESLSEGKMVQIDNIYNPSKKQDEQMINQWELPQTSQELALRQKIYSFSSNKPEKLNQVSEFSFQNVLQKLQDQTPTLARQQSYKYSSFNPSNNRPLLVEPRLRKQESSANMDIFGTVQKKKSNESFIDKEQLVNSPEDKARYEELFQSDGQDNDDMLIDGLRLGNPQLLTRRSSFGRPVLSPSKFMADKNNGASQNGGKMANKVSSFGV